MLSTGALERTSQAPSGLTVGVDVGEVGDAGEGVGEPSTRRHLRARSAAYRSRWRRLLGLRSPR